jgi:starvation-inducible DNA-binding protein
MKNQEAVAGKLNTLLSSVMVYYQNVRGYHWNIKGPMFFELHVKFEELYTDAAAFADTVAERILQLKAKPLHTYSDFLENSVIKEAANVSKDAECVANVVSHSEKMLDLVNEILELAQADEDEGTSNLMSDQVNVLEQRLWMFKSWLS